jgi:hypothetical protein
MAKRKTIEIEFLKGVHERMTLGSMENPAHIANVEAGKAFRTAINIALEAALFEAECYKGYRNLVDHKIDDTARFYYSA